jgi:hypothetical protein
MKLGAFFLTASRQRRGSFFIYIVASRQRRGGFSIYTVAARQRRGSFSYLYCRGAAAASFRPRWTSLFSTDFILK